MNYDSLGTVRPRSVEENTVARGGDSITCRVDYELYGRVLAKRAVARVQADPMQGSARVLVAPSMDAWMGRGGTLSW